MTAQFARAPHRGRTASGAVIHEPHAALLIDFDNVTMGIRSDLTKELKNLLNSDIIKGKVAVQRAYADWRRYPQYIVPLAESSVDLIFAPAYGSAKKNATDIRLAIDAVELVFTRPEIGTIILLSGDSDFSSLVLKLKEYGKYVIGVGIRESASDLLVQNCDEYYSYSALTGLTRAGDEAPVVSEDPWELVDMAYRQMVENSDVMRSDRLKQVLLELDPGFDEKALGFQKFNKFLQDAASRGLLSLRKQENGQYEIGPPSDEPAEVTAEEEQRRESRSRRGRRGRGRRDERREEVTRDEARRERTPDEEAAAPAAAEAATGSAEAPQAQPIAAEAGAPAVVATDAAAQADGAAVTDPAAADREAPAEQVAAKAARKPRERADAGGNGAVGTDFGDLAAAYRLLRQAASDLVKKSGQSARDSDVKRRMLELQAGWDESALGFSKFSRFLRQAHDAEVVTLRRDDSGNYDVVPGNAELGPGEDERGGRRERGRERGREPRPERTPRTEPATARPDTVATPATVAASVRPAADTAPATGTAAAAAVPVPSTSAAIGMRRGSRGRSAPSGPPPLLEGQTASVSRPVVAEPAEPGPVAQEAASDDAGAAGTKVTAEADGRRRRGRKTPAKASAKAPAKTAAAGATSGGRQAAKAPAKAATPRAAPAAGGRSAAQPTKAARVDFDPAALGLPTDPGAIATYITSYKGVGPRSVQTLIETFGTGGLYKALQTEPDRVREVVGGARGEQLIEAWTDDIAERRAQRSPQPGPATKKDEAPSKASGRPRRSGRRGGRRTPGK
jgi:uncharacterized protein (TIGR00288 family)